MKNRCRCVQERCVLNELAVCFAEVTIPIFNSNIDSLPLHSPMAWSHLTHDTAETVGNKAKQEHMTTSPWQKPQSIIFNLFQPES